MEQSSDNRKTPKDEIYVHKRFRYSKAPSKHVIRQENNLFIKSLYRL